MTAAPLPIPADADALIEVCTAIYYQNAEAKRAPHVLGTHAYPSKWDRRHADIDGLLHVWEALIDG